MSNSPIINSSSIALTASFKEFTPNPLDWIIKFLTQALEASSQKYNHDNYQNNKSRTEQETVRNNLRSRLKKAENLTIALAILANKKYKLEELDFEKDVFLEVVQENLNSKERWFLAELIYELYQELTELIQEAKKDESYNIKPTNFFYNQFIGEEAYFDDTEESMIELLELEENRNCFFDLYNQLVKTNNFEASNADLQELETLK